MIHNLVHFFIIFLVTIKLDLDANVCSIAINGGMFFPVFNHMERNTYHAYINFSQSSKKNEVFFLNNFKNFLEKLLIFIQLEQFFGTLF